MNGLKLTDSKLSMGLIRCPSEYGGRLGDPVKTWDQSGQGDSGVGLGLDNFVSVSLPHNQSNKSICLARLTNQWEMGDLEIMQVSYQTRP